MKGVAQPQGVHIEEDDVTLTTRLRNKKGLHWEYRQQLNRKLYEALHVRFNETHAR